MLRPEDYDNQGIYFPSTKCQEERKLFVLGNADDNEGKSSRQTGANIDLTNGGNQEQNEKTIEEKAMAQGKRDR